MQPLQQPSENRMWQLPNQAESEENVLRRQNVILKIGILPGGQIFAALFSEASSSVSETESRWSFD